MEYWDCDAILSEITNVPCKLRCDMFDMAEFDPSASENQTVLPKDSKVNLPLWLARWFANAKYVTMELPRIFKPRSQAELLAGPTHVDLRAKSPHFYELGLKLATIYAPLNPVITKDLTNLLTVVLLTRFLESIIPRATPHAKDSNAIAFLDTLTEQERRIYELRTNGIRELILWRRGMLRIIAADPNLMAMKITSRKRKAMTT